MDQQSTDCPIHPWRRLPQNRFPRGLMSQNETTQPPTGGLAALKRSALSHGEEANIRDPESSIVAYDTETSDADVKFGQILQFGAVTADASFQPREETQIRIRRLPYIVPAPGALDVNGLDPFDLDSPERVSEFEAAKGIRKALVTPYRATRVFLTFNGIKFDDEIIRTTLARNLLDPYVTSGKGNRRIDVLSLTQLANAGAPGAIIIPIDPETGKPSFRLSAVAHANAIEIVAHDAMGDSRATLSLAKTIHERCRWAWDIAFACGNAELVENQLRAAGDGIIWLFSHYGEPELIPCMPLAVDGSRRWVLADVRRSPSDIPEGISDLGEASFGRDTPLKIVRAAAAPMIVPGHEIGRFGMAVTDELLAGAATWRAATETREKIVALHNAHTYAERTDPTSEERLYDGFYSRQDKDRITRFLTAPSWAERAAVIFDDGRLRDYAARLILTNINAVPGIDHERLANIERDAAAMGRPLAAAESRWMTIEKALDTADDRWRRWAAEAFPVLGLHGITASPR